MTASTARPLNAFSWASFDVVGTLIDFETAIITTLAEIAAREGRRIDPEEALSVYRQARYESDAGLFPDDLGRCYSRLAGAFGLTDSEDRRKLMIERVGNAEPFPDSAAALARLARHYRLIAMTNARRWALDNYARKLGNPFHASFTSDDTDTEKPDPEFFRQVFAHVEQAGGSVRDILHVAQSQHHDIGISRKLGMTNVWIERRHSQAGYGGTIEPASFTTPDYHFHKLEELAAAVDAAFEA